MRPLRHPLVLRVLALVLLAGTGAAWVPTAEARDARTDALRSLLDDADAFDTALRAAEGADGDAAEAFAAAYAETAGHAVSAEAVRQILRGQGVGSVAPVLPDRAFVPASSTTPAPSGSASAAVLDADVAPGATARPAPPTGSAVSALGGGVAGAVQARGP